MQCPKCGHAHSHDSSGGRVECEKCGVIFAKVILTCPRCGYTARGTEIEKPNHCPECGVDVARFLSARNASLEAKLPNDSERLLLKPAEPLSSGDITNCPICMGVVAYGVKNCPHCGKARPAPRSKRAISRSTVIAAITVVLVFLGLVSRTSTDSSSGNLSLEFRDQAASLINLNGFLCAEVESAFKPREDKMEVTCKLYRQGSDERRTYIVHSLTGKVVYK